MSRRPVWLRLEEDIGELLAERERSEALHDYREYADRPAAFVREVLGARPWEKQVEIARAVRDERLVTVRSCHAAGKDWLAARLALWWVYARYGLVLLTGPTADQVEETLMRGEVRDAFSSANLPGELHVRALRVPVRAKAGIVAKTATATSALTGFHDARVLVVITEAQHPDLEVAWKAGMACTTGEHDRLLTLGNPEFADGPFYRANRPGSGWRSLHIAASDVPNVREEDRVIPGLLSAEGVADYARTEGRDSRAYRVRVRGEFPERNEEGLFRRSWLEAAARRHEEDDGNGEGVVAALDPSRQGPSESVLALRRGTVVTELVTWSDTQDTARLVERVRRTLMERNLLRCPLLVDAVGIGASLADRLRQLGLHIFDWNGGRSASVQERFVNLRAEAYWRLARGVEEDLIALPEDETLFEELLSVRWRPTSDGRIRLESKRDLTSRLGRSPDRADAVAMVCYPRRAEEGQGTGDRRGGVVEAEVSGNFLDPRRGDPRWVVDEDRRAGWQRL